MNEKYKQFIIELSDIIQNDSDSFVIDVLEKEGEQNTSDLINLVLSAHISSLFTCMKNLGRQHTKMDEDVKKFLKSFTDFISKQPPIKKIEII